MFLSLEVKDQIILNPGKKVTQDRDIRLQHGLKKLSFTYTVISSIEKLKQVTYYFLVLFQP